MPLLWLWQVPRFCPWQPTWDPPWQPTDVPPQLSRHIPWPPPRQLPWQSTVINRECHGIPRQFPRQSSHGNCHGSTRQLPRHSTGISSSISPDVNPLQLPRETTEFRGHPRQLPRQFQHSTVMPWTFSRAASNFRGKPWHSAAIATVISTANNGKLPRQFRRQTVALRGHPRQLPRQFQHSAAFGGSCHGNGYRK